MEKKKKKISKFFWKKKNNHVLKIYMNVSLFIFQKTDNYLDVLTKNNTNAIFLTFFYKVYIKKNIIYKNNSIHRIIISWTAKTQLLESAFVSNKPTHPTK